MSNKSNTTPNLTKPWTQGGLVRERAIMAASGRKFSGSWCDLNIRSAVYARHGGQLTVKYNVKQRKWRQDDVPAFPVCAYCNRCTDGVVLHPHLDHVIPMAASRCDAVAATWGLNDAGLMKDMKTQNAVAKPAHAGRRMNIVVACNVCNAFKGDKGPDFMIRNADMLGVCGRAMAARLEAFMAAGPVSTPTPMKTAGGQTYFVG